MRKFTFVFILLLGVISFAKAQNKVIEDFESIKMNSMAFGTTGMMTVVPNPDPVGNPSINCVKFLRPGKTNGGEAYSGFWSAVPVAVDVTVNKYVHVKVWKSRISPLRFKLEGGTAGTLEISSMNLQTKVNEWEDIVFDFSAKTGTYPTIAFMPDFEDPLVQATDLTMYFDDIYVNNDPAVGSAPVQVIENYEMIPMTRLSDDNANDLTSFSILKNPDPSGINKSDYVLDFMRDKDAVAWIGFWAPISGSIDVTTNKYVHVKLWKPRISVVKFKLQDGAAGTLEISSMNTQTIINGWEDFVFDFSSKTGTYPILALLLDNSDVVLADDIHIYVDDILVNNTSIPMHMVSLTLNVDMNGVGLVTGDKIYVAGTFPTGEWNEPGTNAAFEMLDGNADKIYTITMQVPVGTKAFKFFKNAGWGGGEWPGDPNRSLVVTADMIANYVWGSDGMVSVRDNKLAGKIQMYPNPVSNVLTVNSTADLRSATITSMVGKVIGKYAFNNAGTQTINTSDLSRGIYLVTFIEKDGTKVTQKLIKD